MKHFSLKKTINLWLSYSTRRDLSYCDATTWPEDTWRSSARESLKVPRVLEAVRGCERADEISESREIGEQNPGFYEAYRQNSLKDPTSTISSILGAPKSRPLRTLVKEPYWKSFYDWIVRKRLGSHRPT